jgi:hypothetical protein
MAAGAEVESTLPFGGARIADDFVGLSGGRTATTINSAIVEEILGRKFRR